MVGQSHASLDRAVYAAYGWPADIADDILERLLAENLRRTGMAAVATPEPDEPDEDEDAGEEE
jgi:hypothetical protein